MINCTMDQSREIDLAHKSLVTSLEDIDPLNSLAYIGYFFENSENLESFRGELPEKLAQQVNLAVPNIFQITDYKYNKTKLLPWIK